MRPVSSRFLDTIRGSHRMAVRARLVTTYQTGTDPDGEEVPVLAGDVAMDASADVRSTLDLTTDGTGWATDPSSSLVPYGNELYVERGLDYGSGTREWVGLGYFRLYSVEQDDAPHGPLRISGRDRSAALIDARLLAPRQFAASSTLEALVDSLVLEVLPDCEVVYDFDAGAVTLGRAIIVEEDRYAALGDAVTAQGKTLHFDHAGRLQISSAPDPASPVWDVNAGASGVLVTLGRGLARDGIYNAVIAVGEAPDAASPVRAVATDMNPDSPTYWLGKFGQVPRTYSSPFLATTAQARNAAEAMLARSIGLPHAVNFDAVPNPALEPLDPVNLQLPNERAEVHILESLTVPLSPDGTLQAVTRKQTDLELEVA